MPDTLYYTVKVERLKVHFEGKEGSVYLSACPPACVGAGEGTDGEVLPPIFIISIIIIIATIIIPNQCLTTVQPAQPAGWFSPAILLPPLPLAPIAFLLPFSFSFLLLFLLLPLPLLGQVGTHLDVKGEGRHRVEADIGDDGIVGVLIDL